MFFKLRTESERKILEFIQFISTADGQRSDLQFSERKNIKLIMLMTAGQQQPSISKAQTGEQGVVSHLSQRSSSHYGIIQLAPFILALH